LDRYHLEDFAGLNPGGVFHKEPAVCPDSGAKMQCIDKPQAVFAPELCRQIKGFIIVGQNRQEISLLKKDLILAAKERLLF
jgi:hypothetical protein